VIHVGKPGSQAGAGPPGGLYQATPGGILALQLPDAAMNPAKDRKLSQLALKALSVFEAIGLIVITLATLVAGVTEVNTMVDAGTVTLADLLLLFLYLEILAMVGVYFRSGQLPVRFPIYIAIVALARYLVLDMKSLDDWRMLGVTASMLLLAIAVLVIRYGHTRFPYNEAPQDRDSQP
jgi:protein PsiE